MQHLPPVITIDGPVGSGKGTISQMVATKLGWHYLESGALYRILALSAEKHQINLEDEAELAKLAGQLDVKFIAKTLEKSSKIFFENQDVSNLIRQETVGTMASKVSVYSKVREALLQRQRDFLKSPGLVADGRDMGTVIFPDAYLKFFLTASVEERAKRRQLQLLGLGIDVKLAGLVHEIAMRDERDEKRKVSPLKPADNAIIIDTTSLSIEGVFDHVWSHIQEK